MKSLYKPIKPLTPFKANLCLNLWNINGKFLKSITNMLKQVFILSHIFKGWNYAFRLLLFFTMLVSWITVLSLRAFLDRIVGPRFIFIIFSILAICTIFRGSRLSTRFFWGILLWSNRCRCISKNDGCKFFIIKLIILVSIIEIE